MKFGSSETLASLVAIAESRTFLEAATRLQVSQAALTFRMKQLEAIAPQPIFAWRGKKKVLTVYGTALAQAAHAGLEGLERHLFELNRRFENPRQALLRVAGRSEWCEYFLSQLKFPGRLKISMLSNAAATRALLEREVDLAFLYEVPDSPDYVSRKIYRSRGILVGHRSLLPKGLPQGGLWRDRALLSTLPWVFYREDRGPLVDMCRSLNLDTSTWDIRVMGESWSVVLQAVGLGHGFSVVPSYVLEASPFAKNLWTQELPSHLVAGYTYSAVFPKELLKIPVYADCLRRLKEPGKSASSIKSY